MSKNYKVHVQAKVDADLVQWFEENFSLATKQSFIESCFRYLRIIVESKRLPTPEVYTAASVLAVQTELKLGD